MSPLRRQMIAALHLSGKSERTPASSVREVRLLAQFSPHPPTASRHRSCSTPACTAQTSTASPQPPGASAPAACASSLRTSSNATGPPLALLRAQTTHHLPAVLSVEDVRRLLAAATPCHHHVSCTTVSRWGLRLQEARFLQVSDIDGQRLQVHVHRGKGAKDRYVPYPPRRSTLLRTYWKTHRHTTWLFPATGRDHTQSPTAASPMSRSSVQGAFRKAKQRADITKTGVAIHTLRYAWT